MQNTTIVFAAIAAIAIAVPASTEQTVDCIKTPCLKQGYPDHRSHDMRIRDAERFVRRNKMLEYGVPTTPKDRLFLEKSVQETMDWLRPSL